jgi:hypothetical protein
MILRNIALPLKLYSTGTLSLSVKNGASDLDA